MKLKNKIAIVTGGASGFGAGIVRAFIEHGAKVVIADQNLKGAEQLAQELGVNATPMHLEVSDQTSVGKTIVAIEQQFGCLLYTSPSPRD